MIYSKNRQNNLKRLETTFKGGRMESSQLTIVKCRFQSEIDISGYFKLVIWIPHKILDYIHFFLSCLFAITGEL